MSPDKNRSNLRFPPQTFKIPSDQLLCKYLHRPPSQTRKRQRKEKRSTYVNRKKTCERKTKNESGNSD